MGLAILILLADRFLLETTDNRDETKVAEAPQDQIEDSENAVLDTPPKTQQEQLAMRSIAVLPFANLSNYQIRNFPAGAISDAINDNLAIYSWIRLASRAASFQATTSEADPIVLGETLKVAYIVTGRIQQGVLYLIIARNCHT